VGALTPIILLYEEGTDVGDISKYCCALRKPFTANSLCEAILFAKNFTSERFEECGSENSYYPVNSEDYVGSISEPFHQTIFLKTYLWHAWMMTMLMIRNFLMYGIINDLNMFMSLSIKLT